MFEKEVYIGRRKKLLELMKEEKGIAVFPGNVESPAQYVNNCYKWRQDSTWLYLFGIDEPRFAAIVDLESGEQTIYADDVDLDDIIWNGPMPSVSEVAATAGVSRTRPYAQFVEDIRRSSGRQVHFVPQSRIENAILLSEGTGIPAKELFSAGKKGCTRASESLTLALISMRICKDETELEEIDRTAELGYNMHTIARKGIRPGRVEQEIVGDMEGYALGNGWGVSFSTILTQHGEIFHCHSHDNLIAPGKLVVVDAGVESNLHYASDHTRTYPASGKFTQKQKDIYSTVYECNELAFSRIKPGVAYKDCHLDVVARMLSNLRDLGLVRGNVDDMVKEGIAGLFMPHGLGHNMGLDVHDMEDYGEDLVGYRKDQRRSGQLGLGSLRMARELQPGNVITDEPGIYFIPALIEKWKKEGLDKGFVNYSKLEGYYDFGGIRLEDDVIVTETGARRSGSGRLPISPDEVEAAMANDKD